MTVGLVIVSHSTQLAAGVAELAGQMAQGKTPIAAAGGAIDDVLGTSVDKILAAIQSVDGPDGVLVLLDLGSAILSTEMALEMLDEEQRDRIRLTFAPIVEGAVAAALEASLGRSLAEVQQAAENAASKEQLQQLKPLSQAEGAPASAETIPPAPPLPEANAIEATLLLTNPTGLHARPASLFVQTAAKFQATIQVQVQGRGQQANATSIMGVLSLGARKGDTLVIHVHGEDAQTAIEALSELVRANFYETAPPEETTPSVGARLIAPPASPPKPTTTGAPWRGITTSPGVALGPAFLYTSSSLNLKAIEQRTIPPEQVAAEQTRLREATAAAAQELRRMATDLQSTIGQAQAAIFEAQALMLQDPSLEDAALHMIEEQHSDAASALAVVGEQQASTLEKLDDPLLAARAVDVRDAVSRAIQRVSNQIVPRQDLSTLSQPVILVARDLTPSDTALLRPATVLGICTTQGGPTAHAAILARALGIPAIAGFDETVLQVVHAGDEVGLDADNGLLYHQPAPEIRTQLAQRLAEQQQRQAALKLAAQQAQTPIFIEGRRIHLLANIGSEAEAEAARQWGAEGVGLLRTEFLFASAATLPGEDDQRQRYIKVFRAFGADTTRQAGPIVVRTLDAGADKPMPALTAVIGTMNEANPALGVRGVRIHLAHQALFEQQLSALLRAAAETGVDLHIMFPMITTVEELNTARAIFDDVYERLKKQQVAVPGHVPIGIMVEVPSAAIMANELAERADFFSIGANDLLQYTLACDRTNAALASLYHPMQPAVLRLIAQVSTAGRRAGKPVAVCGEMASDVRLAPLLVGLGVDELSMTPTALPGVRTALSRWAAGGLTAVAEKIIGLKTVAEVEQACKEAFL
jgi:multiphosphoryl transfer protein